MSKRLLLVEDDATLSRAIARLLRKRGHEVFLAGSSAEAMATEGTFSLGIFDVDLPDGDGVSLADELVKTARVRRVIFYSGSADGEVRNRAEKLGLFVEKLRGFPELYSAIERSLLKAQELVVGGEPEPSTQSTSPPPSGVQDSRRPKRN